MSSELSLPGPVKNYMNLPTTKPTSEGICYGCRHVNDIQHPTIHCQGTGDLEPTHERYVQWNGFRCVCSCRLNDAFSE